MHASRYLLLSPAFLLIACTPAERTDDETARLQVATGDTIPAAAPTVHVVLNEWSVSPSESAIAPGNVRFHAMNEGQYHHALEIERDGQQWAIEHMAAGGTGEVTVNVQPGTYTLYCPIVDAQGNHRERGMSTTFTVR
jgi:plastocyanin